MRPGSPRQPLCAACHCCIAAAESQGTRADQAHNPDEHREYIVNVSTTYSHSMHNHHYILTVLCLIGLLQLRPSRPFKRSSEEYFGIARAVVL